MCGFKLSHGVAIFILAILSIQVQLVAAQFPTATSVINGQAQWQGTAVSTNPFGHPHFGVYYALYYPNSVLRFFKP